MMNHDLKYFWNDTVIVVYVSVSVQSDFNLYTFLSFLLSSCKSVRPLF